MSVYKVFSVYDSKAEAYLQPFFARTSGEAIRMFKGSIQNPESNFSKFPEDFTLFEEGSRDDQTGEWTIKDAKSSLGCALEYMGER